MDKIIEGVAGADLSSLQWTAVYKDGTDSEQIKSATDATSNEVLGILQNAPADDGRAEVMTDGFSTAIAGEALEPFDLLTVGTGGKMYKAEEGECIVAQFIPPVKGGQTASHDDAAASDEIRVRLMGNKRTYLGPRMFFYSGTLDFGSITNGAEASLTLSAANAATGDAVIEAWPSTFNDGLVGTMYVYQAGSIRVTVANNSGGAIDPASATYGAWVVKRVTE